MENIGNSVPGADLERAFGALRRRHGGAVEVLRPWAAESLSHALRDLTEYFTADGAHWSCYAGLADRTLGSALVFRMRPSRSLLVAGTSAMADELRRLVAEGAAPGWDLHPVPGGRTPLCELEDPLLRESGNRRFCNALERAGFAYIEEVAAAPDKGLIELRNSGLRLIACVRTVIAQLSPEPEVPSGIPRPGAASPDGLLPAEVLRDLRVVAGWAAAHRAARTVADLAGLMAQEGDLPADIAQARNRLGQLDLRLLGGA